MIKLYIFLAILFVISGIGYGAYAYYSSTQATIATLRENNTKLEFAVETAEASLETMKAAVEKTNELNKQLQSDLQAAEAYTDELRSKFSRLNLVQDALRDPEKLEGKMNGATAKLWRNLMESTGSTDIRPVPEWLRRAGDDEARDGSQGSDKDGTDINTDSGKTQADSVE